MADLRLKIVMDLAERVLSPLRNITKGSSDAAKALRQTRDRLKELTEQQKAMAELRTVRGGLAATGADLQAAKDKVKALAGQAAQTGLTAAATAKLNAQLQAAEKSVDALRTKFDAQSTQAQRLRETLARAGLSVSDLHGSESRLRAQMDATTASIDKQKAALAKHAALKAQHSKAMTSAAMMGAAGAGAIAAGGAVTNKIQQVMTPYAAQEDAGTGLKVAMMRKDGSVADEFKSINDLAVKLGDKLPGTTADFQNMMTMLVRQGMSAKAILGGMGEASAYLGVQLKMPVTAAAEFAAKMQDATQTTEGDMMGLMDVIQKTFYLGVDSDNMLQGMTKAAAIMPLVGKAGLDGAKMLAPMLVMMDQAGMRGEASGNALRKVFQLSVDEHKTAKANKVLASLGRKEKLEFLDKDGKFAGFDNLVKQLDKIKAITHDGKRTDILKKMFGDDAETHQVLQNLMQKGMDGYHETVAKMEAQASLNQRVNAQLDTLSNIIEAAQGNVTNLLSSIGETYKDELKAKVKAMGEVTTAVGAWVKENKELVGVLLKIAAVVAVVLGVVGTLGVALAAIRVPLSLVTFGWGLLGLKAATVTGAIATVGASMAKMGLALLSSPIFLAAAGIALAAYLIWRNWDGIKGGLIAIWQTVSDGVMGYWDRITGGATALWNDVQQAWSTGVSYIGGLVGQFVGFGGNLVDGLIGGITTRAAALKDTVVGMASDVADWFKQKLGIQSPSRVFMEAGGFIADGTAVGITEGQDRVRRAVLGLTAGATLALPSLGQTSPLVMDNRPPLSAAAAFAGSGGASMGAPVINITVNAAPGMDGQALSRDVARAVAAELARRDSQRRAGRLSALGDLS